MPPHSCAHDANGNVTQVVNLAADPNNPAGALIAKYEYDPYGNNRLDPNDPNESGTFAATNPFRFSTKYFDVETGLAYFGGRYYHAALGRWLNRDPIGELGGANLYAYAGNDPVNQIDPLGHAVCVPGWHGCSGTQPDYDGGGRCPRHPPYPDRDGKIKGRMPRGHVPIIDRHGKDRWCGEDICDDVCARPRKGGIVGGEAVCDGKGGVCGCVCSDNLSALNGKGDEEGKINDKDVYQAFEKCKGAHEAAHCDIQDQVDPPPCVDKPAGEGIPGSPEHECSAYKKEAGCLGTSVPANCFLIPSCSEAFSFALQEMLLGCLKQCQNKGSCLLYVQHAKALVQARQQTGP